MGFFRRSAPTLEQCIEKREYECIVRFYLKGMGDDAAAAMSALLFFSENDPRAVADVLGGLNDREMMDVARAIVQSGGPDHPAVLALARYAGAEAGRSLGRAVMRCGEDAFDILVNRTGDEDQDVRLGAISLLGCIGKSGIPVLKKIVYHAEGEEQRTAAKCLRRLEWIPEKPDDKPMFFFLCDEWDELIRLKERALPLLFSLVKKDDPILRQQVIHAMGETGDKRVVPVILPYLDDSAPEVRIAALTALVRYDTPETERCLVSALNHTDSQIRIDAAHALKRKGWSPRQHGDQIRYTIAGGNWDAVKGFGGMIIPDLIRIVRTGDNEWVGAVHALTEMGPAAARELEAILPSLPASQQKEIIRIFKKSEEKNRVRRENIQKLYHSEGDEQRIAARCLQDLGWTPEKPEDKPMFFFLCGDWKGLIGMKDRALPLLFSLIKKDDPALRRQVIQAMGEIDDKRVVPAILPYMEDSDPDIRIAAFTAMMRYDTPETERSLVSALNHADSQIRIDAAHALKRKGWSPRNHGDQIRYTIAGGNWDGIIQFGDPVIPVLIHIVRTGDNEWPVAVHALAELGPAAVRELEVILPSLPPSRQKEIIGIFKKSEEKNRLRRENIEKFYHSEGAEQRKAAGCLQGLGWTPEKSEDKAMFFFLCDEWDELIRLKERALPLLFSLIKKDDPALRRRVIKAMGEIGDKRVIPVILPYMEDCDPNVRISALHALICYDTPETERCLVGALNHADSQIRIDAAHALKRKGWTPRTQGEQIRYAIASGNWGAVIRLGDPVIPDLIRIVRSEDNEWMGAVYALAGLGPDAAQKLEAVLPSLPETQQKNIIGVFRKSAEKHRLKRENLQKEQERKKLEEGEKKNSEANQPKGPTDDEIRETQKRVIEGFKWLRLQKVATEQIYAIISEGVKVHNISFEMAVAALSSKDEAIRAAAVDVLSMKGERAYPYILKAAYDKSQIVRTAVADAIGFTAQTGMMKVLSHLSKDPSVDVRLAVVRALQMMNNERAFPFIINLFSDEDAGVRDAAAHAAATYGQFGLPVLLRSLQVQDSEIRISAAAALGEICDVRSLPFLLPHLEEPDRRVRDAIRAAIVQHDYRAIEPLQEFIEQAAGEAKNAALLALYEINPVLAGDIGADSRIFEEAHGAGESISDVAASPVRSIFSRKKTGFSAGVGAKAADAESASSSDSAGVQSGGKSESQDVCVDSRTCEELVLRIEGGEDSLSSALLVDLYDEKSSLKSDLMSAMRGSDREFAMHAATLLSKIGWSPAGSAEETLFLLASGRTADLKKGGETTARILSAMVSSMPPSVQNTIVDVLSGIGGREGIVGLAQIVSGESGAISDAAAEMLAEMDSDVVPFIREAAMSQEGARKKRLLKIIRIIEEGK
ncbi:HEAT repeat domain-containing protein [Methanogenium sp. S4BF]|uniref:HEAT repeat domain-containing protein n=1 Tax=Methanogenium sp. S4BF TaxID=1789226 RepID=UPI002416ABF9|nr:HEAT repeat domain-containing protein [Methanogenium sp. S4BF]WFN34688.1 HEAT repeat domain-containing protein [Methanogenium sp. S4BF]